MENDVTHKKRLGTVQCVTPAGLHRMAYAEWGEPDNPRVLVCVHGLTRVGADFDDFAVAMSDHYRVVCPDVVGRGRSDWLRVAAYYQVPIYVSDMVTLLARLDVDTVDWFGTSMGGMIGMGLASLQHAPITRMLLNDVGPVVTGVSLDRIGSYVGKQMHFPDVPAAESYIRQVAQSFGTHSDAQWQKLAQDVIKPDADGGVRLHYDPAIAEAFQLPQGTTASDVSLWHLYDKISCPVLAVRGELSDLLTPETHAQMASRGPCARLATIAAVGHAPTFVSADQIALARDFFLEDLS